MNKILLAFKFSFISLLLLTSCSEDDLTNEANSPVVGNGATPSSILAQQTSNQEIAKVTTKEVSKASVLVHVVDEFGAKVNGATVTISDNSLDTQNGVVIFNNIDLNKEYVGVKITHPEYITAIKNFTPSGAGIYNLEFKLFKGEKKTFSATSGQEITFESGVALDFSNTSFVNANGSIYQGTVNVNTYYHNPSDADYLQALPGALVGVDGEEISALVTEGMITVDLTNTAGEEIFVNEGASVKVTMPADANAPATIDLWHLNEKYGIWTKTGAAVKNGAVYEFEVNHFSTYNLDVPVDALEKVEFVVITNNLLILKNTQFEVFVNDTPTSVITTDENGKSTLLDVPAGDYFLKPITCLKDFSSNVLSLSQSGNYEFVITHYNNSATFQTFSFSGWLRNCENYYESNEIVVLRSVSSDLEFTVLTSISSDGYFYTDVEICSSISNKDKILVEITLDKNDYVQNHEFVIYDGRYSIGSKNICDIATVGESIEVQESLLEELKKEFGLDENEVITKEFAAKVEKIGGLADNGLSLSNLDFSHIAKYFVNLKYLHLYVKENLVNFNTISSLESLEILKIDVDLKVDDVLVISKLQTLRVLSFGDGNISDISSLSNLTNLTELGLWNNDVKDTSPLSGLINLTKLGLGNNNISDISSLSNLTNLTELSLWNNNVTDISSLSASSNLTYLDLSDNKISDISSLSHLTKLTSLDLSHNLITDISFLSELTNLNNLFLYKNLDLQQSDVDELQKKLPDTYISF